MHVMRKVRQAKMHVSIQTNNIAKSLEFYSKLGFTQLITDSTTAGDVYLTRGEPVTSILALHQTVATPRVDHVGIIVDSVELEYKAQQHGAEIETHRDGSRGFYIKDPDGISVEVISLAPTGPLATKLDASGGAE